MSFKGELAAFAAKSSKNMETVTRKVLLDIGTRLIERTPVGDPELWQSSPPPGYAGGRARGSWQYGFSTPVTSYKGTIDPSGSTTLTTLGNDINPVPGIHFITSVLPYMQALEDGHSTQAPNGMVGLVKVEFLNIVEIAVKELGT